MRPHLKFSENLNPVLKYIAEAVILLCLISIEAVLTLLLLPRIGRITVIINLPIVLLVCMYFKASRGIFFTAFVYIFNSVSILFIYKMGGQFEVIMHGMAYFAVLFIILKLRMAMLESQKKSISLQEIIEKDHRTSDELAESENRFKVLFEYSPAGIVLMETQADGDWKIIDCNQAYGLMNGYKAEELIGQSVDILHIEDVALDKRAEFVNKLHFGSVFSGEYIHKRKDGKIINVEYNLTLVKIYNRTLIAGMDVDITDRIKLAGNLKTMNTRLEQQVKERTRELEKTMVELKTMVREREILLQEIHHRVKNNLQLIQSLLSLQMDKTDDANIEELLRDSKNRILSMAMIHESMYQSQSLSEITLHEYVKDLAANIFDSRNANSEGIKYELDIDDTRLNINQIVPVGLIITEIITNSLKHAFTGKRNGIIAITIRTADNQLMIKICDNGTGFVYDEKKEKNTLGFLLIESLVLQLKGSYERITGDGVCYDIRFTPERN